MGTLRPTRGAGDVTSHIEGLLHLVVALVMVVLQVFDVVCLLTAYTVQQHRDHYGDQQEEGDEADGDHWNTKHEIIVM